MFARSIRLGTQGTKLWFPLNAGTVRCHVARRASYGSQTNMGFSKVERLVSTRNGLFSRGVKQQRKRKPSGAFGARDSGRPKDVRLIPRLSDSEKRGIQPNIFFAPAPPRKLGAAEVQPTHASFPRGDPERIFLLHPAFQMRICRGSSRFADLRLEERVLL